MRSAPALSASMTCAPRRVKSAARMDGASLIVVVLMGGPVALGGGLFQLGRGGAIDEPDQLAVRRPDQLAGQTSRVGRAFEDLGQQLGLVGAGYQEIHVGTLVQDRRRQGQAVS